jgi:hypothetical protein
MGAGWPRGRSSSPGMGKISLLSTSSTPVFGPSQTPIQWVPGALPLGVKLPGCEDDHSSPTNAEVKNTWIFKSTPPYVSLIKHRENFTHFFYPQEIISKIRLNNGLQSYKKFFIGSRYCWLTIQSLVTHRIVKEFGISAGIIAVPQLSVQVVLLPLWITDCFSLWHRDWRRLNHASIYWLHTASTSHSGRLFCELGSESKAQSRSLDPDLWVNYWYSSRLIETPRVELIATTRRIANEDVK